MNNPIKTVLLMSFVSVMIASCSSGGSSTAGDSSSNKKASKAEYKISDCLEDLDYDYAKMLTAEDISKHAAVDLNVLEHEDSGIKGEYGSVVYSWSSDRPPMEIKISSMTIPHPDDNNIGIKMLSFYEDGSAKTVELFSRGYKELSEEELEAIHANLEKHYSDPEELKQAKSLMETREGMNYELVEGLGTRAYWKWGTTYGGELITLVGRSTFTITIKTSNDPQENLELAKKIAQGVIDKCS